MHNKTGRNDNCPCGSGKKYKKCCLEKENSTVIDFAWRKLRQLEGELVDQHLIPYATKLFPIEVTKNIVNDIIPEDLPEDVDKGLLFTNFFMPWFLFNWIPFGDLEIEGFSPGTTIALKYKYDFSEKLSNEQKRFIDAICETYYSFYVVLEVIPEQAIIVKDILLGKQHKIKERTGTRFVNRGDIVFSRILTLDEQSIFIGMAPLMVPARYHHDLIKLREDFIGELAGNELTAKLLRDEFELDMIDYFFSIIKIAFARSMPILHNTDGEIFQPCKSYFKVTIGPEEALEKLLPLTLSDDPSEFLYDAKKNKSGEIITINFPWLKKGNKKHKGWDNTLLGHITIKKDQLILETNSEKRCKRGQTLLKRYLGEDICFQKTVIESVERMLKNASTKSALPKDRQIDLSLPEVQEQIKVMMKKHWEHWFDEPIPALDHQTPRQAAKTKKGRELLEALLLGYESHDLKRQDNLLKPDIPYLRAELRLEEK